MIWAALTHITADYTDYWTSELFQEMKYQKKLFRTSTDLGFVLSTNGVQVFKARTRFSIWPIVLECLNLPPTIRKKRQNLLCTGFIPGPKGPINLDSFLYPLVKEFEVLQRGIPGALNASIPRSLPTDRKFTLKAHICLIGADMVAREKVTYSSINDYKPRLTLLVGDESNREQVVLLL